MRKKQTNKDVRLSIVKQYEDGADIKELSNSINVNEATIYRWLKEYRAEGNFDRKKEDGRGRPSKISGDKALNVLEMLKRPASEFGFETDLWNTTRIKATCKKELKFDVSRMGIWRFFVKFNKSFKTVKKEYYESSKSKQDNWKRNNIPKIKEIIKKKRAILYFEDESSIQLSPVMGKSWGDVGKEIIHKGTGNKGSIAAISAISNNGKLLFNLFDKGKRFNADDMISFLNQMLKYHPNRHLVVVMDRASCHTSNKFLDYCDLKMHRPSGRVSRNKEKKNKRLHVFLLPPRSPKLNPDEQVWFYLKHHGLKSHQERNLKGLMELAKRKLNDLQNDPKKLIKIFKLCENHRFYLMK